LVTPLFGSSHAQVSRTPFRGPGGIRNVRACPRGSSKVRLLPFDEVQQIFAEHLPIVHFVAPKVFVAASSRVMNLTPVISRPQLLWTPDTIAVKAEGKR